MGMRLRMILAWSLFIAWVCWLGWQSYNFGRFPVVSHSQFLTADLAVIASLDTSKEGRPSDRIRVKSVVWPNDAPKDLEGKEITVGNWSGCDGFLEAGEYVIPLTRNANGDYSLAGVPRSPLVDPNRYRKQIYPNTPIVIKQLGKIMPAKK